MRGFFIFSIGAFKPARTDLSRSFVRGLLQFSLSFPRRRGLRERVGVRVSDKGKSEPFQRFLNFQPARFRVFNFRCELRLAFEQAFQQRAVGGSVERGIG